MEEGGAQRPANSSSVWGRVIRLRVATGIAAGCAVVGVVPTYAALPGPLTGGPLCFPVDPVARPQPDSVRFGVDPGPAGNLTPVATSPVPAVKRRKEMAALRGLQPDTGRLVVRLNRLFWSGGEPLLREFAADARRYASSGFDVEVQVRYHPAPGDVGHVTEFARWVRHVVDVLGRNRGLVALTVTNEVNLAISPNTSDGFYPRAEDALIRGVEAAADEVRRHAWSRRIAIGFTFAYRFNPVADAAFFDDLGRAGGRTFRRALGFVGLDDYPGTFYPPAMYPGSTPGSEVASAIATMRDCYLPRAGIGRAVPLWVTENGFSSATPFHSEPKQSAALTSMVDAVRAVAGTYHVTDYRWFNLRDNDSSGRGMFDQVGLLRDDYSHKPSYAAFRREING